MPLCNPFRRQSDRPSLRERAADLRASLSRPASQPGPAPVPGSNEAAAAYSAADTATEAPSVFGSMAEATKAAAADALSGFGTTTSLRRAIVAHQTATVAMLTEPDESDEATERASAAVEWTGAAIRAVPAVSLADVRAKLAMLLPEILPDVNGSAPTAFLKDIQADVDRLATREAEAMTPYSLTAAILDLWPIWAAHPSDDGDGVQAFEHMQDHRFALIDAAEALPATREAIIPKALALAWLDYVDGWRRGRPRNGYSVDGRLALDIHAAATNSKPEPRARRATALAAPKVTVVVTVDFAAAPISTLGMIAHTMGHLAAVAHALSSSLDDCAPLSYLLTSLAEEFDAVQDGAEAELQRRRPTGMGERRTQLAAVADRIISNGDDVETATFIQDLAAWAAEQARR